MLTSFTRIMVPLDGSARAERSVLVAAKVARATGGSIALVRVISPQVAYGPAFVGVGVSPVSPVPSEEEHAEVTAYLTRIAGWPVLSGISVTTHVLIGPIAPTLLEEIHALRADAVILTSHGRTGVTRWVLGSVAQHLAQHANVPCVVLREHGASPVDERGASPVDERAVSDDLYRMLVPLDGSLLAEEALAPAARLVTALAAPYQATLHLVFAASPYDKADPTARSPEIYLSAVAQQLTRDHADLSVTWSVVVTTDTAESIVHMAETGRDPAGTQRVRHCNAIAMATHGRSGLTRWMMGSITQRVMQTTNLPLLIVRPRHVPDTSDLTHREHEAAKENVWSALF